MKALYTTSPGDYGLADRPDPKPGLGEVVIRVESAGFCYNDLRIRSGVLTDMGFPFVPGHQFAGVVEECGAGVEYTRPGDRVAVHPYVLCGMCASCRTGGTHDCERFQALGFTLDGGLAQYAAAPEKCLFELPDHVDMEQGSLLEKPRQRHRGHTKAKARSGRARPGHRRDAHRAAGRAGRAPALAPRPRAHRAPGRAGWQ